MSTGYRSVSSRSISSSSIICIGIGNVISIRIISRDRIRIVTHARSTSISMCIRISSGVTMCIHSILLLVLLVVFVVVSVVFSLVCVVAIFSDISGITSMCINVSTVRINEHVRVCIRIRIRIVIMITGRIRIRMCIRIIRSIIIRTHSRVRNRSRIITNMIIRVVIKRYR